MPVEIRELVIKATVVPEGSSGDASGVPSADGIASDELIQLCVEKVLEILREKNER